ncbi:hypothetical protein FA09DRAFT_324168 [Tilletiopsis washingtonensis]|uniref:Uncharacterized protein n=1 Tax=Tilletiopsis washingtonensis TaxID=58919 RepID=A0A316ZJU3_9BASI|nr:hypothetical protein FA09DRAFT_324168 [Tilletiopsis washingtonensis]PWO01365.1 hypothetical protein FA09DRAFT_324168 [Tilletiopsis washingtonensis]
MPPSAAVPHSNASFRAYLRSDGTIEPPFGGSSWKAVAEALWTQLAAMKDHLGMDEEAGTLARVETASSSDLDGQNAAALPPIAAARDSDAANAAECGLDDETLAFIRRNVDGLDCVLCELLGDTWERWWRRCGALGNHGRSLAFAESMTPPDWTHILAATGNFYSEVGRLIDSVERGEVEDWKVAMV